MGTYLFAECSLHIDVEEDDDEVEDRVISDDGEPSTDEEIEHGVAVAQNTGPQMLLSKWCRNLTAMARAAAASSTQMT